MALSEQEIRRQTKNLLRRKSIGYTDHKGMHPAQTLREFMEDYAPDGLELAKDIARKGAWDTGVGCHYVRDSWALSVQLSAVDQEWAKQAIKGFDKLLESLGKDQHDD